MRGGTRSREGGSRGFGSGEVGGRGTGPRDGANFRNLCRIFVSNAKNDALWGGGVHTGAGLVDRAVNQGPWLQEKVWGA